VKVTQKQPTVIINKALSDILDAQAAKSIDTRGMACPYPSFQTVKTLNSINANDILEVITDSDESALDSIPTVCEKRGLEFLVVQDGENLWRVRIKK